MAQWCTVQFSEKWTTHCSRNVHFINIHFLIPKNSLNCKQGRNEPIRLLVVRIKARLFASFPKCLENSSWANVRGFFICQIAAFTLFPNLSFPNISEMKQTDMPLVKFWFYVLVFSGKVILWCNF